MLFYNKEKYHISGEGVIKHIHIVEPPDDCKYGAGTGYGNYIAAVDPIEEAKQKRIAEIEVEIHQLKTVGINADETEEEKGIFALYDAVAEHRMIEELEKELAQLQAPTKGLADIKIGKLCQDGTYEADVKIRNEWGEQAKKTFSEEMHKMYEQMPPMQKPDTYNSLEEIRDSLKFTATTCDIVWPQPPGTLIPIEEAIRCIETVKEELLMWQDKVQRTISSGMYLQKGEL